MKRIILLLTVMFVSTNIFAQEIFKSIEEEYYDFLSLTGIVERPTLSYRTLADTEWKFIDEEADHPWKENNLGSAFTLYTAEGENFFLNGVNKSVKVKVLGPEWFNSENTVHPYGQNDGALWQGAGYNTYLTGGVRVEAFGLELTFKPQLSFTQNKYFETMEGAYGNKYSYFTRNGADIVQRYGDEPFWNYDWGDSEIRYTFYNFTVGFGTSNPWIGPAYVNPMLGSNNSAGIPKLDFGLRKTQIYIPGTDIYVGDIEGRVYIGQLQESDYFDNNPSNDKRMLDALFVSFAPSGVPGLTIGANRIIISYWKDENIKYFGRLFTFSKANSAAEDQKISLFFDYLFPSVGFEVYGEYGADDFTSDISANPFHTGIYTLGIKQHIPLWKSAEEKGVTSELIVEFNDFEMSQDFQIQWEYGGYYSHYAVIQGYTQKGQVIGAGSGYFGTSQYINYSIYYPKGKTSLFVHRSCPNNNYIYNLGVNHLPSEVNNRYYASFLVYYSGGIKSTYFITPSFQISAAVVYDYIHNFMYVRRKTLDMPENDIKDNFHLELALKYNF